MTRNKKDNHAYSGKMILNSKIFAIVTIALLSTMVIPLSYAQINAPTQLVKITANSWKTITVVKVENSSDNIYNIKLVWLTLENGSIKSFRAEEGWNIEVSSSPNTIQFSTDNNVIKPSQFARFGIKTDQPSPIFKWIVIDEDGDELGSGTLDVVKSMQERAETVANPRQANNGSPQGNTTPPQTVEDKPKPPSTPPAIAIVPDTPRPGMSVRFLGEGFMPDSRLTVLFDGKLIETLKTEPDGTIRDRIKIPETAVKGAHQIAASDSSGRAANLHITVEVEEELISFTVATAQPTYKRGELVKIVGVGKAGAAVSLRAVDPSGNSIFSSAVPVDRNGNYAAFIPLSETAVTGDYLVSALQDGRTITTTFKVLTEGGSEMSIITDKFEYKQGESVIIKGQAGPNKDVSIRVLDPNSGEIFSTTVKSDSNGNFTTSLMISANAPFGKYSVAVRAGNEEIALNFSVVRGSVVLTVLTDKTEYRDGELVRITGKGKPSDRVSIIILTPKEDRIPMSANTKEDGTYSALWLVQKTAAPGTYKVIVQQGESRVEAFFSVFS
ncbi:MAG: hypothetical protein QW136_04715 [Nitrososphaerales archaeon]